MNSDEKKLVLARLETFPDDLRLSVGPFHGGREDVMKEVEGETRVGEQVVYAYMEYLRSFKNGTGSLGAING